MAEAATGCAGSTRSPGPHLHLFTQEPLLLANGPAASSIRVVQPCLVFFTVPYFDSGFVHEQDDLGAGLDASRLSVSLGLGSGVMQHGKVSGLEFVTTGHSALSVKPLSF